MNARRHERRGPRRLARNTDGAMAVTLAISLLPLTIAGVGAIDLQRGLSARSQLQDALDAATLAAARAVTPRASPPTADDDARLTAAAIPSFGENLGPRSDLRVAGASFRFDRDRPGVAVGDAEAELQTILGGLVLAGRPLRVSAHAEVVRGAKNLEAALVLDVTGSMSGSKLEALKGAANDLVQLLVREEQTPYYSKVALVPYSAAVNLGSQASEARGKAGKGCTAYGCERFRFTSATGEERTFPASTCVTERTASNRYTDASYTLAPVGFHYAGASNGCLASRIVPLSSDRAALTSEINGFRAEGSTAGHIGLAWGWYSLAPGFAELWPAARRPAGYDPKRLLKVVVLMTDGMFNTAYRKGVISEDSQAGSGHDRDHIRGDATNGDSFEQARALCEAMKAQGVLVYAVGFDLDRQPPAEAAASRALIGDCASTPDNVYLPETGADLREAFHQIGEEISALRIAR